MYHIYYNDDAFILTSIKQDIVLINYLIHI